MLNQKSFERQVSLIIRVNESAQISLDALQDSLCLLTQKLQTVFGHFQVVGHLVLKTSRPVCLLT